MQEVILKTKELTKKYKGKTVVDSLDLEIRKGEIFGLLGPNGAGKSTTMNMVCSITKPTAGSISLLGINPWKQKREVIHRIGYIPQELAIHGNLKAWENVELFTSLYGIKGQQLKETIDKSLEYTGLLDKRNEFAKNFSGGMKRRLNIACAIGHNPEILFFDEPTVGIDPQSRNFILGKIKESNRNGATVVYTSHYMEEVEAICSRIAIMDNGKVIACGTSGELKRLVTDKDKDITLEEVFLTLTGKQLRDYTIYEPADVFQAGYQIEKGSFWESSIETIKRAGSEAGIKLSEYPEGEPEELVKNGVLAGFVKLGTEKYTVYENADNETEGAVLEYFFSQCLSGISSQVLSLAVPGIANETLKVQVKEIDYMPAIDSKDYYGIIETVYFSFLGIICMAGVLASEKKNGIGIKYQVTPLTDFKLYIAKWFPAVMAVAAGIGVSAVLSAAVYGIRWGNLFISAFLVLLVITAGISFGFMLYAVSGNIAVTVIILFSSTFFMGFFGGTFETYMYSSFPEGVKNISPVYHVNRALVENSCMGHSGYTVSSILYLLAINAACTFITLVAGWAGKKGGIRR